MSRHRDSRSKGGDGENCEFAPKDASFFIVTGASKANLIFQVSKATRENKERAIAALKQIGACGGTVISS